jgi:hypothetical protein
MIIYKDIVTESRDELLADSFDITEVDGVLYEVNCSMVEIGAVNVDTDENGVYPLHCSTLPKQLSSDIPFPPSISSPAYNLYKRRWSPNSQ